ncbi:hypothetical protein JTE88_03795 [Arcanobacterium phocisimile]|uniref:Uncharacterized protein n=1 Tax=Arcanobacterium phocisimile TaxID=1302235 RepID=A0ABX7IL69_9ACTO|nr:hypothetical protein [Arcanobacterium phocisimile]QRV02855.1 hypothetical protein JTE88_03795 [Arcanobacterium phocisimile]
MRIALVATALAGCEPDAVASAAVTGWKKARPADDIDVIIASDGVPVAHVGTGLSRVFQQEHKDAVANEYCEALGPRRIFWVSETDRCGLLDLAEAATWDEHSDPRGSSAFLAHDIMRALELGLTQIRIHLPALMAGSDVGLGLLSELSGIELSWDSDEQLVVQAIEQARHRIGPLHIVVSYPFGQALAGFDGLAHTWQNAGLDPVLAQDFLQQTSGYVHKLERIRARWDLSFASKPFRRYEFDGVGGGLGLLFVLLRARLSTMGSHLVFPETPSDLYVYVTNAVELHVPSGLSTMTDRSQEEGNPAILVVSRTELLRGELARLGLNGMYKLQSERAEHDFYHDDIVNIFSRLASTWGWDV